MDEMMVGSEEVEGGGEGREERIAVCRSVG